MKKLFLCFAVMAIFKLTYADTQSAIFSAGCFWCAQSDFDKLKGVVKTEVGYDGGTIANPTYEIVSAGDSGYSEAIKVTFDPKVITYTKVLDYYWHHIDPTDNLGQFCDKGLEYRSKIFYLNSTQQQQAKLSSTLLKN